MLLRMLAFLVAVQVPTSLLAQTRPLPGWYATPNGQTFLVSPGPAGDLRLFNVNSLQFHRLEPDSTGRELRLVGQGSWATGRILSDRGVLSLALSGAAPVPLRAVDTPPFTVGEAVLRSDTVRLAGLLLHPEKAARASGTGKLPGVVMIHGSGSSDRDNIWAFTFAEHLVRQGMVVLFLDKRGSGASGGDWRAADFTDLAGDAIAGAEYLRTLPRVDVARVGLVGLSQGGWVAMQAAVLEPSVAFVVAVSAAAVTPIEQLHHEVRQDLTRGGHGPAMLAIVDSLLDLSMAYSRSGKEQDFQAFLAYRTQVAERGHAALVEPFGIDPSHWRLAWWGKIGDFDPVAALRNVETPTLVVYGSEDQHDNVPVAASVGRLDQLRREQPDRILDVSVFPGMGHTLVSESRGWVALDVLAFISDWIVTRR